MTRQQEIEIMAKLIAEQHKMTLFPMCKVREVLECSNNNVAGILKKAGVTVKKIGNRKLVTAAQLAEAICYGRVSPTDNRKVG